MHDARSGLRLQVNPALPGGRYQGFDVLVSEACDPFAALRWTTLRSFGRETASSAEPGNSSFADLRKKPVCPSRAMSLKKIDPPPSAHVHSCRAPNLKFQMVLTHCLPVRFFRPSRLQEIR